jgi:hypothetical protein
VRAYKRIIDDGFATSLTPGAIAARRAGAISPPG